MQQTRMGSDATAVQTVVENQVKHVVIMAPETSTAGESFRAAATVSPTESEIATVAYRFWRDNGCPVGSDQEDWFRAEAALKNDLAAKCEGVPKSILRGDTGTESGMPAGLGWEGHWEVWEREWGGARWIWDIGRSKAEVSKPSGAVG
jgi:hypothetical protein